MTEKQIVALLNEPSGSEENLEALAKEHFSKVEKVICKKYTKEEIYDTFEKLAKAEAEMVAAVRKVRRRRKRQRIFWQRQRRSFTI